MRNIFETLLKLTQAASGYIANIVENKNVTQREASKYTSLVRGSGDRPGAKMTPAIVARATNCANGIP
jgi:hypothetical protein